MVTGTAPAPVVAPQSESARAACLWHKDKPDSYVESEYGGVEETRLDEWNAHLVGTPFAKNSDIGYKMGNASDPCGASAE